MGLLRIPPALGPLFRDKFPGFWEWLLYLDTFISSTMRTEGDVTCNTAGKGLILTNAAGSVTKRVRLNDAGNGLVYEDP